MWKQIDGYMWPYRINEEARVQKFYQGKWVDLHPCIAGRNRAEIKMRTKDNRKIQVPLVWLMADAFMGGRKPGYNIYHLDGSKLNCAYWNLKFMTKQECGKITGGTGNRRAVLKIDKSGEVVAIYKSSREAARKEYISYNAMHNRCLNKVQNPFDLTGYNYQYEDSPGRKLRSKPKKGECLE